jgi:hypothetical protein
MKYMLLIYDTEQAWTRISEPEQRKIYGEYMQFTEDIKASRNYLAGSQLHPVTTASSVRVRDGKISSPMVRSRKRMEYRRLLP